MFVLDQHRPTPSLRIIKALLLLYCRVVRSLRLNCVEGHRRLCHAECGRIEVINTAATVGIEDRWGQ